MVDNYQYRMRYSHDGAPVAASRRQPEAQVKRLTRQIEKLGYTVTVSSPAPAA